MKKYIYSVAAVCAMMSLAACSSDENLGGAADQDQQITIALSSTGDNATRADRNLTSEEAGQDIQSVTLVVRKQDGTVAYTHTIDDWQASSAVYTTEGHGRQMTFTIPKADKLAAGETYYVTAIGYNEGNYTLDATTATKGDAATNNFTAQLAQGATAKEIFAGESQFEVGTESGKVSATTVTLHRQVAGTYGYFTSIPAKIGDKEVKTIRMVARSENTKMTFGGFNSDFEEAGKDGKAGQVMYVVNGSEAPATTNAHFMAGDEAYTLFSANVKDWFPQGDENADGVLNSKDASWTNAIDPTNQTTIYKRGSIFASNFVIPFAATDGKTTLELQLLDETGAVLYAWPVKLDTDDQIGKTGESVATAFLAQNSALTTTETADAFSFFRNHIYAVGLHKTNKPNPDPDPEPGTDEPTDLGKIQNIVIRVNDNWEAIHHMTIDE